MEKSALNYLEKEHAVSEFHEIKNKYMINLLFFKLCNKNKVLSNDDFNSMMNNTSKIIEFYYGKYMVDLKTEANCYPIIKEISRFLKTFKNKDLIELLN